MNRNIYCLIIIFLIYFSCSKSNAFTIELIYRDSPKSPLYNASLTRDQLLINAAHRSSASSRRASATIATAAGANPSWITSRFFLDDNHWSYLLAFSIGTPPKPILAVADTGSDLIWVQCDCWNNHPSTCYPQENPFFRSNESTTFTKLSCETGTCPLSTCKDEKSAFCTFDRRYMDNSRVKGIIAHDVFTFSTTQGGVHSFINFLFGCGDNNSGKFSRTEDGFVGLGRGRLSLISQLVQRYSEPAARIFSYCMVYPFKHTSSSSFLRFGPEAIIPGTEKEFISTPLIHLPYSNYYHATLHAITVGLERFYLVHPGSPQSYANIIIDSATPFASLRRDIYDGFEVLVKRVFKRKLGLDPMEPSPYEMYPLCYYTAIDPYDFNFGFPTMTFHFTGADVAVSPKNTFTSLGERNFITGRKTYCMTIHPTDDGYQIYGGVLQSNFQVKYDLGQNILSFRPTDCSKV